VVKYVVGVRITGFAVHGFSGIGIIGFGAQDLAVDHTRTTDNGEYGVTSFESVGSRFIQNEASGSGEAGFYFGDSPNGHATIRGNRAHDNGFTGLLIRNASFGLVEYNSLHDNCTGVVLLAGAPGPVRGWTLRRNDVFHNDRACPASDEAPPVSGVGIALGGTRGAVVVENNVVNNRPSGPSAIAGGIAVAEGASPGFVPVDNTVRGNSAFGNRPVDLSYDGTGSGNSFVGNSCDTSSPAGLCR
jgi:hypothetical protein